MSEDRTEEIIKKFQHRQSIGEGVLVGGYYFISFTEWDDDHCMYTQDNRWINACINTAWKENGDIVGNCLTISGAEAKKLIKLLQECLSRIEK